MRRLYHFGFLCLVLAVSATLAAASDWYVSPAGRPQNAGTRESPWDIGSALAGAHAVKPGGLNIRPDADYIWIWDVELLVSETNRTVATGTAFMPRTQRTAGRLSGSAS
jgi:hypothetical protein